jgi:integrase
MATVNFYLDKPKSKTPTQIFLFFSFKGKRIKVYTGERIPPKYWDEKNQKVKTAYTGSDEINAGLKKLDEDINRIYREAKILGKPLTTEHIKEVLLSGGTASDEKAFFVAFTEFLKIAKTTKAVQTVKSFQTTYNHLKGFEKHTGKKITFATIDLPFGENLNEYLLTEVKLANNTIAKIFKNLKTFLTDSAVRGFNTKMEYRKFKIQREDKEVVFLSWNELMAVYNAKLTLKTLEKVRDVFCFGCFTGMRYSDIYNLRPENIKEDEIIIRTQKTKEVNSIPLNNFSKAILDKYASGIGKALPVYSNQKMNEHLKSIGKLAKLDEIVSLTYFRGAERVEISCPKHELLTTHIARKTFITNSLQMGMRTEVLKSITGHKSERAFKRYYKIVDEFKKSEMQRVWDRNLPEISKAS